MHINLKIEHARRLMDKLHERNRKQGEDLKRLIMPPRAGQMMAW